MEDEKLVEAACEVEGCSTGDLLRWWVRPEDVVLIIKPGRKRVVPRSRLRVRECEEEPAPAPVAPGSDRPPAGFFEDVGAGEEPPLPLEETPPPVTFEGLLAPRVVVILEQAGLLDPEVLRGMSDKALEGVPGIGRRTVKLLREALREYEERRRQPGLL